VDITLETVEQVAKLACLELNDEERTRLPKELSRIFGFVETLNELDLEAIQPKQGETDSPVVEPIRMEAARALRPDEAKTNLSREELLQNAPESEEGCFVVPRILAES
jgi:aspartyl-tRNA(Asn)/glutamyl-tRNA(Gln) amidotransferase subunit C